MFTSEMESASYSEGFLMVLLELPWSDLDIVSMPWL
jgi:hypothetical protein